MTDKNANTEIRKEFCPNCEAETPCTHEAELFVCDICGEDFAKYIVSRNCNVSDVSVTQNVLTDIKTGQSIENTNPDYYKQELARIAELEAMVERLIEIGDDLAGFTMSATGDNGHSITLRKWHALVDRIQKEREE